MNISNNYSCLHQCGERSFFPVRWYCAIVFNFWVELRSVSSVDLNWLSSTRILEHSLMFIMPLKTSSDLMWIIQVIQKFRVPVRSHYAFLCHQKQEKSAQYVLCIAYASVFCTESMNLTFLCFQNVYLSLQPWCEGGYSGVDLNQRSFYFWMQTGYRARILPPTEQDTCNRPLTPGHFESLSPSLRAGANPCCVYHTTGTTAGWSVYSLAWTSWYAGTYGYYLGWCGLIWLFHQ